MSESATMSSKKLEGEYRAVGLFVENAKTYIQLSTGALLLSVTFSEGVSGRTGAPLRELYPWISWISWLVAILAGVTYQYCVAKYLEEMEFKNGTLLYGRAKPFILFRHWVDNPYKLYGVMLVCFYGGTTWFAFAAVYRLLQG